jgi:hypothetical protein
MQAIPTAVNSMDFAGIAFGVQSVFLVLGPRPTKFRFSHGIVGKMNTVLSMSHTD